MEPRLADSNMPETRRSASDDDALALRLVVLLNDDQVLEKLKNVLYPHALAAQIKSLIDKKVTV